MSGPSDWASETVAHSDAVRLAERYIGAYTDRDLEAMLAVMDEAVVSYPAPLFGHRPHYGHAGVRDWWAAMLASDQRYEVVVREVRQVEADRVAVFGEIRADGSPLSPWAVLLQIRGGLIIESRSYLSDTGLLEELGLLQRRLSVGQRPAGAVHRT